MADTVYKFSLPFRRILCDDVGFIVETETGRYRLSTGISEHYIMSNLAAGCKNNGTLVVGTGRFSGKPALLPFAIKSGGETTWIATTPDESTDFPPLSDPSPLEPFKTQSGKEYPDGFIDPSRTSLPYAELMILEKTLHETAYVTALYDRYRERHPDDTLYDARLHYYMIKGIRKHKHYTDDFVLPCDEFTFYLEWNDPFPSYLYIKTFGKVDSWPSYAKMRLMADNRCTAGIPLALKVMESDKANDRIMHYAIVLAGLDEGNTGLIMSLAEKHPRAVARVLYERGRPELYPMLLDDARNILAGMNDDILDDFPVIHNGYYDRLEEYTVNHRGYIRLDTLGDEEVRGLWEIYRGVAQGVVESRDESERLRLGNAFRAFLLAVIYNRTAAVAEIIDDVYRNFNFLLYSEWSQDSKYKRMDIMWLNYLYGLVVEWNILDNFWQWLQFHARRYDHYYLYTNQHFFLSIYSKVAYHMVEPELFYDALAPLIDSNYVLVEAVWTGVTGDEYLADDDPLLDHRWNDMFCRYHYYSWTGKAQYYYMLVRHRIEPHPKNWSGKWEPERKRLKIVVPR